MRQVSPLPSERCLQQEKPSVRRTHHSPELAPSLDPPAAALAQPLRTGTPSGPTPLPSALLTPSHPFLFYGEGASFLKRNTEVCTISHTFRGDGCN